MAEISRIGDFSVKWGESLCWDDQRDRLYFVDSVDHTLYWLEGAEPPLQSMPLPSLPGGVVPGEDGRLVVALDDGLHVVDPDAGRHEHLSAYPEDIGARANDAAADLDGNLVTGSLNTMPEGDPKGSYWWFSSSEGWRRLDGGIVNANGPVILDDDDGHTLVFADTFAFSLYAYDYDGERGTVANRRVFADTSQVGGMPDGACADATGAVWSCVLGAGKIARYTSDGLEETIDAGVEFPSDVTFGGPDLDRMFYVSIAVPLAGIEVKSPLAGALMVVDGISHRGRREPRFRL